MRSAVVIHDSLRFLGGGELICLTTCLALQRLGYRVRLVSDGFSSEEVETAFGLGKVIKDCEWVDLPRLGQRLARHSSLPGLLFGWVSRRFLEQFDSKATFVTRDPGKPVILPRRKLFRFIYEKSQLHDFWETYRHLKPAYRSIYAQPSQLTTFLGLSSTIVKDTQSMGYRARLLYPSYGIGFQPRPKKNEVVQVTFVAPQKKLEDFCEVARRLPRYRFWLVGRDTERINRIYGGYARRLLSRLPTNVEYVESRIHQVPELLEESRVYFHTGVEPGMTIAVMEALSAGCIGVAPVEGGAGEVLRTANVGFCYDRIEEAAKFIDSRMRASESQFTALAHDLTPEEISERAKVFSLDAFQRRIRDLLLL